MNLNQFKRIGTTIAFFLMAVVYAAIIWGLALAGHEAVAGQSPDSVITQLGYFVGYAVLAGLMVDVLRFSLSALWRRMGIPQPQRKKYASHSYA